MALVKARLSFELELEAYNNLQALEEAGKFFGPIRECAVNTLKSEDYTLEIIEYDEDEMKADEAHQQSLHFSECGEFITVDNFWDCECETDFTHRKLNNPNCPICGSYHSVCSDSRGNELLEFCREMLTNEEIEQIEQELERLHLPIPTPTI